MEVLAGWCERESEVAAGDVLSRGEQGMGEGWPMITESRGEGQVGVLQAV